MSDSTKPEAIMASSGFNARRRNFLISSGAAGLATMPLIRRASAQMQRSKQIRAIVPFAAGSGSDIVFRIVSQRVAADIGRTIVVENRTGAGGVLGASIIAKSDPDGDTILLDSSAHTTRPFFYKKLDFDPIKDFASVASIGTIPLVCITATSKGFKTAKDLVAYAKANPGKVIYASGGSGSATHLAAERFRVQADFTGVHVPFRGGQEGMLEVLAGRVDFYFIPILPALAQIKNGSLTALAVSQPKRSTTLPDVPTLTEAGYPNSDYNFWLGAFVHAKTPVEVVDRLHTAFEAAVKTPEVAEKLAVTGTEPMLMSRADFDKFIDRELGEIGPLITSTGMVAE
jgi:tripartite-type tricarboxylate transporter receptor subunit TctC